MNKVKLSLLGSHGTLKKVTGYNRVTVFDPMTLKPILHYFLGQLRGLRKSSYFLQA